MDWTPVCYFYHGFPFEELVALYYVADVAVVTPLRDGMNLVAKEYIAVKDGNPGVLILSEMAGAAVEMTDALLVNPNDTDQIENAIYQALEMPDLEQQWRLNRMQKLISTQTVERWAGNFIDEWEQTYIKNRELYEKCLSKSAVNTIKQSYRQAKERLILLDYDGTLAPICNKPEEAKPTTELMATLQQLTDDPSNKVVVNSGRDHGTLEKWLGNLHISLAAEHGAYYKENGEWINKVHQNEWSSGLLSILKLFVEKTPHSHLEIKDTALAWHYRECDAWLGTLRAQQLTNALISICLKQKLEIKQGNKVIEIKSPDYNKGSEVARQLQHGNYDFIIAMGDDTTDNDMFEALPQKAFTIKVGNVSETARYNIPEQKDVLPFLQTLADEKSVHQYRESKVQLKSAMDFFKGLLKTNKKES